MMSEKVLIQQGILAWEAENHEKAYSLFTEVVQSNSKSEQGWFWLAKVTDSVVLRQGFLELVLQLNPQNAEARQMLVQVQKSAILPDHRDDSRFIPTTIRITVWERDQGMCVKCQGKTDLEYDHIIPHSKGGANTIKNLQLLCRACNRKKSNRIE
jgi:CRISPR/Cas system Type II protein with McrA/HNH and RuvC-like nuclease domain